MTSQVYHVTRVREESNLSILGKCLVLESDDVRPLHKVSHIYLWLCVSVCVDYLL